MSDAACPARSDRPNLNPLRSEIPMLRVPTLIRAVLKTSWFVALCLAALPSGLASAAPVVFEGTAGSGQGKHIVFLAGDHEYRSEETLPELARILAKHHGFKCTVLFNIDKATGEIVAGNSNLPGIEALDKAD